MKYKYFIALLITTLFSWISPAVAVDDADLDELNKYLDQEDIDALRDWVKEKKQHVKVRKPPGSLVLSGEVRTELQSTNEKVQGVKQLGSGGAIPGTATRAWDIEVRLQLDYKTDRTYAAARLRFDNNAGTVSGTTNRIKVDRALFGGKIINADEYTVTLQAGRWDISLYFDSRIQFGSRMDGILFNYEHGLDWIGDFALHGGPFVVDETIDHFAYIGEVVLLNIGRTGWFSKVSYIDWDTKNTGNKVRNRRFSFRNWQAILGYKLQILGKTTNFFAAYLVNTAARKRDVTAYEKANQAWYAGFTIGELKKQWDWSFEFNYQWVEAQAIPSFDLLGIGHGNAAQRGLYSENKNGSGAAVTRASDAVGDGNYQGWLVTLNYLLTDNITVFQSYRQSRRLSSSIGETFSYKQYEVELIYGF